MVFSMENEMTYIVRYMEEEILKILRVDLCRDTFEVIKAERDEMIGERGFDQTLSAWFKGFVDSGQVHNADRSRFEKDTNVDEIRRYFLAGNRKLSLSYRRLLGDSYIWVSMRMIPASDYSPENQIILLFVQTDDSAESLDLIQTAKQQFAIMNSMAKIYVTLHMIDLQENVAYDLSHNDTGNVTFTKLLNASGLMRQMMQARVADDYLEKVLEITDLTTLASRMQGKKSVYFDFQGKNVGWCRGTFIAMEEDAKQIPRYVVFATSAINEEKQREEELSRIATELNLATEIQANCIPNIFPAFPQRKEFDLFASMDPAKEVGGDFYDFFDLDENHIAMVIADVSGKGVPAALFMMVSKVMLKNQALVESSPAKILETVNRQLCENNRAEMFVTVWIGILDVNTGILTAANAGHEYPVVKKQNGQFEIYKDRHGFVLGGMEFSRYKEYEIQLEPGDTVFVYTDGVPEATNADGELFGNNRMLDALNRKKDASCTELIKGIRTEIDMFVKDAPQFDDITMLALRYLGA